MKCELVLDDLMMIVEIKSNNSLLPFSLIT